MKNILYITRIAKGKNHIFTKLEAQISSMISLGYHVDFVYLNALNQIMLNETIIKKINNRLHLHLFYFDYIKKICLLKEYDIVYIRNPFLFNVVSYFIFLTKIKKKSKRLILEIPTYPHSKETNNLFEFILHVIEKMTSFFLKKYFSLIVYSGNKVDKIYGIKSVSLINIGNFSTIPLKKDFTENDKINLIAISGCMKYHGYDRLIRGLSELIRNGGQRNVFIHIVGEGPYLKEYKKLVDDLALDDYVLFHGKLFSGQLMNLVNKMNLGVSCLGMHRIGLTSGSPLKTSEYILMGLPIIVGYQDEHFSKYSFCFTIPSNDTPVNFTDMLDWYSNNSFNSSDIRNQVSSKFSWEEQFKKIFNQI